MIFWSPLLLFCVLCLGRGAIAQGIPIKSIGNDGESSANCTVCPAGDLGGTGVLTVYLDKMTNLPDKDWFGTVDPYVLFELLRNNQSYGARRSEVKRDQPNPVYQESFKWKSIGHLQDLVLTASVRDRDIGTNDDDIIRLSLDLDELGLGPEQIDIVRVVYDRSGKEWDGKIYLKIAYIAPYVCCLDDIPTANAMAPNSMDNTTMPNATIVGATNSTATVTNETITVGRNEP